MAAQKPSIPEGTRDFPPAELVKRYFVINTIRDTFSTFGFQSIETPSFENYDILMGKYGEEGDRFIFKILNSGDFTQGVKQEDWEARNPQKPILQISEKALRYDLTVPFARYVVQHQAKLTFPFKRYQIQPVWHADRPQKGRFRELYQCDADVVGSNSLWQEVEFVQLYDAVFTALNLKGATIKINNRKILSGFTEMIGESDKLIDFTIALDKLDKIGEEGVMKEMSERGINAAATEKTKPIFGLKGSFTEELAVLSAILVTSEVGCKGIEELTFVGEQIAALGLQTVLLDLDVTLARGLNYYTEAAFEITAPTGVQMGSIGGGDRYDDLTSIFGLKGTSGIGISFGSDRIGLVMEELSLYPEAFSSTVKILCLNFGNAEALQSMKFLQQLRKEGKKAELYLEAVKIKKQMDYANKHGIPYVAIVGESELQEGAYILKNMLTGEQEERESSK